MKLCIDGMIFLMIYINILITQMYCYIKYTFVN